MKELERVTRRYTSEIGIIIGPNRDIPAPDVNTNAQIMAWMMDTYSMNTGGTATGVVTGKPIHLGGSLGRVKATGRGVFVTGREAARRIGLNLDGARVAVQGMGNVGSAAAELFVQAGAKIVAMQDHTGTLVLPAGFDMLKTMEVLRRDGGIGNIEGAGRIDAEAFWDVDCDILIPAALEGQITPERANRIKAKLVLEGANGPTLPEADDVLGERGVLVVPDVICNAGGVTVSYFEWVQDFSSFFWSEDEINVRLDKIMVDALKKIWDTADRHKISLRTATFAVACERILIAREERGPLSLTVRRARSIPSAPRVAHFALHRRAGSSAVRASLAACVVCTRLRSRAEDLARTIPSPQRHESSMPHAMVGPFIAASDP